MYNSECPVNRISMS